ncbi:MAG TPA: protease inhibitor I9 family protein, partial [Streptosporangiaceae bacterium]
MRHLRIPGRRLLRASGLGAIAATIAFAAMPASAAPAEGEILHAGSATAVAGSYIVALRENDALRSQGVAATARTLAARYHGAVTYTYQSALQGFAVKMSEPNARLLAAAPGVAYVEQDQRAWLAGTQPNPPSWGLDRIDQ